MRHSLIFGASLLLFGSAVAAAFKVDPPANADVVVARMLARNDQREGSLAGYCGMRKYTLENNRWNKRAEMLVRVEIDANEAKHFEIVREGGWKAAENHVLHKMLDSEAEASSPEIRTRTRMSLDNYKFHLAGTASVSGRMAYVVDIAPRRHEERLIEGQIWVDAEDYALVKVEGKPAKNPSFWIKSVHFIHSYRKSGPMWFPVSTESVTEARIFGSTSLKIDYYDYKPIPLHASDAADVATRGGVLQ